MPRGAPETSPSSSAETPAEVLETIEPPGPDSGGFTPEMLEELQPRPAPPTWVYRMLYRRPGFPPTAVTCLGVRYSDTDGSRIGSAIIYTAGLPATHARPPHPWRSRDVRADGEADRARAARRGDRLRRSAGVGVLSRRLSSASYFNLIRELTTAIDAVVGAHGGIVGKHAGDGVTAFFLATELGSASSAARAALEAAREIGDAAARVADGLDGVEPVRRADERRRPLERRPLHGPGRHRRQARGHRARRRDERVRPDPGLRPGRLGARPRRRCSSSSRRPSPRRLGIDPDRVAYRPLAELPGADEKSIRDAGSVAVAEV